MVHNSIWALDGSEAHMRRNLCAISQASCVFSPEAALRRHYSDIVGWKQKTEKTSLVTFHIIIIVKMNG